MDDDMAGTRPLYKIIGTDYIIASIDMFMKGYAKITTGLEADCLSKDSTITISGLAFHRAKLLGYSLKQDIDVQLDREVCPNPQRQDITFSDIPYIAIDVRTSDPLATLADMFTRGTIVIFGYPNTSPIVIYI